MNRRQFITRSTLAAGVAANLSPTTGQGASADSAFRAQPGAELAFTSPALPDLNPARWLWYPSGRCLPNTFVLFRRELKLDAKPRRAVGWIFADSRYRFDVNGERVQWGPAPCDPRWQEMDPLDLAARLQVGTNVLGATVLYYGHGDGTWPAGKPGFLFWLELEFPDGRKELIVSDDRWQCQLARAWRPGQYKRWYLRALQEEFDARLYPEGWNQVGFRPDQSWLKPLVMTKSSPHKPSICTEYPDYLGGTQGNSPAAQMRARSVPMLKEYLVPVKGLVESAWLEWQRSPREYFDSRTPDSFREVRTPSAAALAPGEWVVHLPASAASPEHPRGATLTFEFEEQMVGWPSFTIVAPAGTIVELLPHEAHKPGGPVLLNTHFDAWTRFVCRAGDNQFETFDFESLRWLQLHIYGAQGEIRVRQVGLRRRLYPWPNPPRIQLSEPALQRLATASVNTLNNCAQETLVDGMGRERQQYSGDCGHQLHAIYFAFGEARLPARFLATYSQGLSLDGYFLDCWPAFDRLARLAQRQLDLSKWGSIIDHGIGFNFDCWHHLLYTGDLAALREPYPRLLRFADFLRGLVGRDGLMPVEDIGTPMVWIDFTAYRSQREKQCAFNLYTAAMFEHALAPICRAFGDEARAKAAVEFGRKLLAVTVKNFWHPQLGLFTNNLPWLKADKEPRHCDRSLAMSILFGQCPKGRTEPAVRMLADCPKNLGLSYPANAGWRLWALGQGGRPDIILKELRERWASMDSVKLNNTLQEHWRVSPDNTGQWSHCPLAPLYVMYMSLAGIQPTAPGFAKCRIRPQLGDLEGMDLTVPTPQGPLVFKAAGKLGARELSLALPAACEGELVLDAREIVPLSPWPGKTDPGQKRYRIPSGQPVTLRLTLT